MARAGSGDVPPGDKGGGNEGRAGIFGEPIRRPGENQWLERSGRLCAKMSGATPPVCSEQWPSLRRGFCDHGTEWGASGPPVGGCRNSVAAKAAGDHEDERRCSVEAHAERLKALNLGRPPRTVPSRFILRPTGDPTGVPSCTRPSVSTRASLTGWSGLAGVERRSSSGEAESGDDGVLLSSDATLPCGNLLTSRTAALQAASPMEEAPFGASIETACATFTPEDPASALKCASPAKVGSGETIFTVTGTAGAAVVARSMRCSASVDSKSSGVSTLGSVVAIVSWVLCPADARHVHRPEGQAGCKRYYYTMLPYLLICHAASSLNYKYGVLVGVAFAAA